MSLELKHLATLTCDLSGAHALAGGPKGTRMVCRVDNVKWQGDRLNASSREGAPAGDWALLSADGVLSIDVRSSIVTDDGADIYVSYQGRADYTNVGVSPFVIAPVFETGDERYAWLNKVQAIGRGRPLSQTQLEYEIYEVL